ncbi:MAG: type-F conjugative transfer system pilin assembly protein TrbC [Burkholderiales bacterium PBB5]|nr:MAG: type-F conjugative transfer system pilin assembly protein TrbC [Burkholderiales bacterium PBB5]
MTRHSFNVTACAALALWSAGVFAQAQAQAQPQAPSVPAARMPTAQEIEAARRLIPSAAEINRAVQDQQRAPGVRVPQAALDLAQQTGPDLSQLAEQYDQLRRGPARDGNEAEDRQASGMLVFVSLGMPKASLQRLVADAERARATLILRGARNLSIKQTTAAITEVMKEARTAWQIDPSLFKRFEVQAVPTYVLIDPARPVLVACGQTQCQQAAFSKVSGDVSMAYALATIEQNDVEFAPVARHVAWRLSQPPNLPAAQPATQPTSQPTTQSGVRP